MTGRTRSGGSPTQRSNRVASRHVGPAMKGSCVRRIEALCISMLLLGGCTVGPKYVRPNAEVPSDYKESENWKTAQPSDEIAKGKWWEVYGDPQLNALEEQVSLSSQTLKAAQAQCLQARAVRSEEHT